MERIIKFRGKRTDTGKWVYGDYISGVGFSKEPTYYIVPKEGGLWIEVLPESLGQFTGEKDQDGNEIYEGDSVEYEWYDETVGLWHHTSATVWFYTGSFQPLPDVLSTRNFKIVK